MHLSHHSSDFFVNEKYFRVLEILQNGPNCHEIHHFSMVSLFSFWDNSYYINLLVFDRYM